MPGQPKDNSLPDVNLAAAYLKERREVRYDIRIEIEVSGIDQNGRVFHESTATRNVSEWGCAFVLSVELKVDDIISLRVPSPDEEKSVPARQSLGQVLRVQREENGWFVGVWKLDGEDLWNTELETIAKHAKDGGVESHKDETAEPDERRREDIDQ